ncbi:hypothetical protein [Streptomyces sp. NPDC002215]|uniref:hypothetical protein n=1 Tax=Streptomyces sp. NPDC002215 TaxID=3154412 RepID=UPI00331C9867
MLPTSWCLTRVERFAQAQQLADSGCVVAGCSLRGFWLSGGGVEAAGPPAIEEGKKRCSS